MRGYTVRLNSDVAVMVRFSAGCAYYPEDGTGYRELLKLADQRMYQEKKEHKSEDKRCLDHDGAAKSV